MTSRMTSRIFDPYCRKNTVFFFKRYGLHPIYVFEYYGQDQKASNLMD